MILNPTSEFLSKCKQLQYCTTLEADRNKTQGKTRIISPWWSSLQFNKQVLLYILDCALCDYSSRPTNTLGLSTILLRATKRQTANQQPGGGEKVHEAGNTWWTKSFFRDCKFWSFFATASLDTSLIQWIGLGMYVYRSTGWRYLQVSAGRGTIILFSC